MRELWEGKTAIVRGKAVEVEGKRVCRLEDAKELLSAGVVELSQTGEWKARRCPHCGGALTIGFECCSNEYL